MTYTVTKLITNSWYTSGIVARGQQTVSGDKLSDGLDLLNDLLGIKTADKTLIPYYQMTSINLVVGQEKYTVEDLIEVETITFNQQQVRFATDNQTRRRYFGSARVNNVNSLPFNVHCERTKGGMDIYVYFLPNSNYPLNIFGKFGLTSIASNQLLLDLETIYDRFYIVYLRYALAEYMCNEYNIPFTPQNYQKLNEFEAKLASISPKDMSLNKRSSMNGDRAINWAYANFPGWTI
jgi:hypothetical protein